MKFDFDQNYKKISEINSMLKEGGLIVDNSYQRKSVWGERDQVRLIETILLNLVVPSLYFWNSETDPENGNSVVHIVDGQQRLTAIRMFVTNQLVLKKSFLLEEYIKEKYGNKRFCDLEPDIKKDFWDYKLSVIEIAREVSLPDIKNMFKRLNLTDYNLNSQEKRNALEGEFASLAKELANDSFWDEKELFTASVIKRMKDVEFCASLILLYKRGIIDQTSPKALNEAYTDYAENYNDADQDRKAIQLAIKDLGKLINDENISFLKKVNQLYTVFSVIFYLERNEISIDEEIKKRFDMFVNIYTNFKNEDNSALNLEKEERKYYDKFKKYKQASSEGLRKQVNRMARFEVLKWFLLDKKYSEEVATSLYNKLMN